MSHSVHCNTMSLMKMCKKRKEKTKINYSFKLNGCVAVWLLRTPKTRYSNQFYFNVNEKEIKYKIEKTFGIRYPFIVLTAFEQREFFFCAFLCLYFGFIMVN